MENKEFGGCLPFELIIDCEGKEYFDSKEYHIRRLNSGRSAIVLAIKNSNAKKVYVPLYTCDSVKTAIMNAGYKIEYYHIDCDFFPQVVEVKNDEILLWVNYFGIWGDTIANVIVKEYKNVIIDNTQAFFCKPNKKAYNAYSCRKFIGVSDGAYLISKDRIDDTIELDVSNERTLFLFKSFEEGANCAYAISKKNEEILNDSDIKNMSVLTQRILCNVSYENIIERRTENYNYLHDRLKNINILNCNMSDGAVPMVYPFVLKSDVMRDYLIKERVFVPTWWRSVMHSNPNTFEETLVKYLFPIPIDQRYCLDDMEQIAKIILMGVEL